MLGLCLMVLVSLRIKQDVNCGLIQSGPPVPWSRRHPSPEFTSPRPSVLSAILQTHPAFGPLWSCSTVWAALALTHTALSLPHFCFTVKCWISEAFPQKVPTKGIHITPSHSLPLSLEYFSFQHLPHTTDYICSFINFLCPVKLFTIYL